MLETFEIVDSSSLAKDKSMLEVAGAVGVDATWMELVEDSRTDVLAEDTPVGLTIDATWMELVEDSGTDVLAEDTPVVLIIEGTWMELVEDPGTDVLAEDTPVVLIIEATWMELVEDPGTDVLAEDTPVVLIIEATWMELVEDPRTDVLAEDNRVGTIDTTWMELDSRTDVLAAVALRWWKIVDITASSVDVVKSPIETTDVILILCFDIVVFDWLPGTGISWVMFSGTVVAMRLASVFVFSQPKVVHLRPNIILRLSEAPEQSVDTPPFLISLFQLFELYECIKTLYI